MKQKGGKGWSRVAAKFICPSRVLPPAPRRIPPTFRRIPPAFRRMRTASNTECAPATRHTCFHHPNVVVQATPTCFTVHAWHSPTFRPHAPAFQRTRVAHHRPTAFHPHSARIPPAFRSHSAFAFASPAFQRTRVAHRPSAPCPPRNAPSRPATGASLPTSSCRPKPTRCAVHVSHAAGIPPAFRHNAAHVCRPPPVRPAPTPPK